jgi:hypothetical protein
VANICLSTRVAFYVVAKLTKAICASAASLLTATMAENEVSKKVATVVAPEVRDENDDDGMGQTEVSEAAVTKKKQSLSDIFTIVSRHSFTLHYSVCVSY